jgi:hypothetical protein
MLLIIVGKYIVQSTFYCGHSSSIVLICDAFVGYDYELALYLN